MDTFRIHITEGQSAGDDMGTIGYICPVCGNELERVQNSYVCPKRHSFDIARKGYVNLLTTSGRDPSKAGDDADMVRARTDFLDSGHYERLADAVADTARRVFAENGITYPNVVMPESNPVLGEIKVAGVVPVTVQVQMAEGHDKLRDVFPFGPARRGSLRRTAGGKAGPEPVHTLLSHEKTGGSRPGHLPQRTVLYGLHPQPGTAGSIFIQRGGCGGGTERRGAETGKGIPAESNRYLF